MKVWHTPQNCKWTINLYNLTLRRYTVKTLSCNNDKIKIIIKVCASARSFKSHPSIKCWTTLLTEGLQNNNHDANASSKKAFIFRIQKSLPAQITGIHAETRTTPAAPPPAGPRTPRSALRSSFSFTRRAMKGAPSRLGRPDRTGGRSDSEPTQIQRSPRGPPSGVGSASAFRSSTRHSESES